VSLFPGSGTYSSCLTCRQQLATPKRKAPTSPTSQPQLSLSAFKLAPPSSRCPPPPHDAAFARKPAPLTHSFTYHHCSTREAVAPHCPNDTPLWHSTIASKEYRPKLGPHPSTSGGQLPAPITMSSAAFRPMFALWLVFLSWVGTAAAAVEPKYVRAMIDGEEYMVRDDRQPALYTADYGDCLGESVINVTRFDAAYYKDNMTVLFHLGGETALISEDIMMSIGVYAYGESRFELTFNPCDANIAR
jgi:hypothetical protein